MNHEQGTAAVTGRVLALALGLICGATAAQDDAPDSALRPVPQRDEPGFGWRLGTPDSALGAFTLGGYAEVVFEGERGNEPWRAVLRALSGILWWDGGGRWRSFLEVELADALVLQPGDSTSDEARPVLERAHFDYAYSDTLRLRLGKFLTPVGRWNLLHAAPLTWTTSRPLVTEATFPTNATGVMVHGVLPWTIDGIEYALYASPGEELFPARDVDTFREAVGLRAATTVLPHTQLGLSFASFEQMSSPDRKTLYGIDLLWSWRRFELSGELAYRVRDFGEDQRDEHGHYLQLVAPLGSRLYAVTRHEGFHQAGAARNLSIYLGGLAYRLPPALVLKAEYARATDNDIGLRDGLRASLAVLF